MSSKNKIRKTSLESELSESKHILCKHCQQLDPKSEELIVLTDNRLLSLYESVGDSLPEDDRPQHRITQFVIHDSDRRFCWFDSKPIESGFELFLCGFVEPIVSDTSADNVVSDESNSVIEGPNEKQIVAQLIGPLTEWWFAGFDGGSQLVVGVESLYASYVLSDPQSDYKQLFDKSTQKMFLTKRIIECLLRNPDLSYEDLVHTLEDTADQAFNQQLLLIYAEFVVEQIKSFDSAAEDDECLLCLTPAIQTLIQLSGSGSAVGHRKNSLKLRSKPLSSHIRPIARVDARRAANSDSLTCSTVLVKQLFDSVFNDVIECESIDSKHSNQLKNKFNNKITKTLISESNPKINWIGNSVYEDRYARTAYYSAVKINEQTYSLGEFAIFREEDNCLRLGRIMFMFNTASKQKLCHFHYFCYANETILAETAPNLLVFMSNQCNDIKVERIVDKIDVCLSKEIDSSLLTETSKSNQYFCDKSYLRKSGRFEDLPKEVFDKEVKQCINCLFSDRSERRRIPELHEEITTSAETSKSKAYRKLIYNNETYIVGNCVLLSSNAFDLNYYNYENSDQIESEIDGNEEYDQRLYPELYRKSFTDYIKGVNNDLPKTLNIGLISEIVKEIEDSNEESKLVMNVFYRPDNVFDNYRDFCDADLNLVFWSNHRIVVGVDALIGVCRVIYASESPKTDIFVETKLFYFNQCYDYENKTLFAPNSDVIDKFSVKLNAKQMDSRIKLNVLDLFAGCGGLSYGFDKLGLVAKLWAIEKDSSAVKSFQANYSGAQVFEEDVNHFMNLLLNGVKYDRNGKQLPEKGDIDLVLGGPPCQGFSGMNRFSSRHYSLFKNSLVVSFLSFVDFYRPKYLLFENVRNFALFKSSMILKLMMSCLIRMGYQCQFAILQAGSYGAPQTRRRTVIVGAASGHSLPHFPAPTHVFSRRQCQLSVTIDDQKYLGFTNKSWAQFRTITVLDAISDLEVLGEDYSIDRIREYTESKNIRHFLRLMRTKSENNFVNDHYCKELSELCRLRIKNIPNRVGSDWRDLPNISHTLADGSLIEKLQYLYEDSKNGRSESGDMRGVCRCASGRMCNAVECRQENTLIPWCLVHTANRQYQWSGLYGRLALNGYFPTTVTNPEPISKQGRVLHPNQNRVISVRESARSQAFPDHFIVKGTVGDKYRQIGNAVPIPLSIALGLQFYTVLNS